MLIALWDKLAARRGALLYHDAGDQEISRVWNTGRIEDHRDLPPDTEGQSFCRGPLELLHVIEQSVIQLVVKWRPCLLKLEEVKDEARCWVHLPRDRDLDLNLFNPRPEGLGWLTWLNLI